jgi:hypothetical protein
VSSLCLDQEDPPERTKMDDPHVLSGTVHLSYHELSFYYKLNNSLYDNIFYLITAFRDLFLLRG